jgi:hypothetical protein
MFTDEFIEELISCPKTVTQGLRTGKSRGAFTKKEFRMQSLDGKFQFKGSLNQNSFFQEDFSLVFIYYHKEDGGRYSLLRCNGIHGANKHIPHHNVTHEHTVRAADLNVGIKDEKYVKEVTAYTTFEQAVQYYVKRINIIDDDKQKYFPKPEVTMPTLFD